MAGFTKWEQDVIKDDEMFVLALAMAADMGAGLTESMIQHMLRIGCRRAGWIYKIIRKGTELDPVRAAEWLAKIKGGN